MAGRTATVAIRSHDLEAAAALGYRAPSLRGLALSLRVGGRLLLNLIDKSYLLALPSERVLALTLGVGLDVPHIVGGLGLSLAVSWLPIGNRAETPHLGEGDDAGTSGVVASITAAYAIARGFGVAFEARYLRVATHFDGTAERDPTITTAGRSTSLAGLSLSLRYDY